VRCLGHSCAVEARTAGDISNDTLPLLFALNQSVRICSIANLVLRKGWIFMCSMIID
jgi:hypothetical protein